MGRSTCKEFNLNKSNVNKIVSKTKLLISNSGLSAGDLLLSPAVVAKLTLFRTLFICYSISLQNLLNILYFYWRVNNHFSSNIRLKLGVK